MWSKKELIDKEARFWVLMAKGSTLQAACDAVGVTRAMGRHWRQATGGQVPRKKPEPSGRYLSLDERLQVADLRLVGAGVRAIAMQIGRAPWTVSRELRRNGPEPSTRGRGNRYAPYAAQKRAELRGRRPKASKFDDPELASLIQHKLCVKWSPEQISNHLATVFGDRREMRVSPETLSGVVCAGSRASACGPASTPAYRSCGAPAQTVHGQGPLGQDPGHDFDQ